MLSDKLTKEVERVVDELGIEEPGSERYEFLIKNLMELDKAKLAEERAEIEAGIEDVKLEMAVEKAKKESELKWWQKLDPNTVFSGAISIGSILTILNFEKIGIITSKALSFIHKPRVK